MKALNVSLSHLNSAHRNQTGWVSREDPGSQGEAKHGTSRSITFIFMIACMDSHTHTHTHTMCTGCYGKHT